MTESALPPWKNWALMVWIAGVGAYYYLNFTLSFYRANEDAIRSLIDRLF